MIDLAFDILTGVVKPAGPVVIKAGAGVPVRLTTSGAPGSLSGLKLGVGSDKNPPVLLAETGAFVAENATVYTAILDATDARLVAAIAGKTTAAIAELVATLNGVRQVSPNFPVTVQPPIVPLA